MTAENATKEKISFVYDFGFVSNKEGCEARCIDESSFPKILFTKINQPCSKIQNKAILNTTHRAPSANAFMEWDSALDNGTI